MTTLTTLLVAATLTAGPPENIDPNLKPLQRLVGNWHVTLDWPDLPFKEAIVSERWALDGKFLQIRWRDMDGNDLGPEYFTWDPVEKTFRLWGFDKGGFYEATWTIDGKVWTGKYTGTSFEGKKTKNTIVLEFESRSKFSIKRTPEGATEPDGTAVFERIPRSKEKK